MLLSYSISKVGGVRDYHWTAALTFKMLLTLEDAQDGRVVVANYINTTIKIIKSLSRIHVRAFVHSSFIRSLLVHSFIHSEMPRTARAPRLQEDPQCSMPA